MGMLRNALLLQLMLSSAVSLEAADRLELVDALTLGIGRCE